MSGLGNIIAQRIKNDLAVAEQEKHLKGSGIEGLNLAHISQNQLDALEQIWQISGVPLIYGEELEDKTMTAEEVFMANVKWLRDVMADVENINFPSTGEYNE